MQKQRNLFKVISFIELCSFLKPPLSVNSEDFWKHFYMKITQSRNPSACITKQMIQGQAKSKFSPSLSFKHLQVWFLPLRQPWEGGEARVTGGIQVLNTHKIAKQIFRSVQGLYQPSCLKIKIWILIIQPVPPISANITFKPTY